MGKDDDMAVSHTISTEDDDNGSTWGDDDDDDDSSMEFDDGRIVIHAVAVETSRKEQKASDLRCYKEITTYQTWFEKHIVQNRRIASCLSPVATLCGLHLTIYYCNHNDDGQNHNRPSNHEALAKTVNKVATMLTFDPNSGLYNHLIRGKAYILLNDNDGINKKLSKRTVWNIQELISEFLPRYHQYGADFTREGQRELLQACAEFKRGKWTPRSVCRMALSNTDEQLLSMMPTPHQQPLPQSAVQTDTTEKVDLESDGPMKRSSASHWFISTLSIRD